MTFSKRLKLFSDRSYIPEGKSHVTMLVPFWGKHPDELEVLQKRRFDQYLEIGTSLFEMTSLEEADIAVMPSDWEPGDNNHDLQFQFAEKAKRAGKSVIVFLWGMSFEDVPIDNAIIFRNSLLRSSHKASEFSVPFWSEDFITEYLNGKLHIRNKSAKPTVGFCGFAEPLHASPRQKLVQFVRKGRAVLSGKTGKQAAGVMGRAIRTEALRILSQSRVVDTNFVIRDRFWAGAVSADGHTDSSKLIQARREYLQNMTDTDYTLCTRGAGNASFRLYETLCCGRIPVFIDTDAVVPYDFAADWKRYCVWVDETEVPHIAEKVLDFHNKLSPQDFIDLQVECRNFWKEWLSPEGFFDHFHLHFDQATAGPLMPIMRMK